MTFNLRRVLMGLSGLFLISVWSCVPAVPTLGSGDDGTVVDTNSGDSDTGDAGEKVADDDNPSKDNDGGQSNDDESLATFFDPLSDFSTTDVFDVEDEIIRFNVRKRALIYTPTDMTFTGWAVEGNLLDSGGFFQVRFGMEDGQRRAYFVESASETICDVEVIDGELAIFPSDELVPME